MKLLIATGLYPPQIGGPATYTSFLEKHLPHFGIEFVVVPYSTVQKFPKWLRHCLYTFKLIRASRGCTVIYALDTVSVGVPACIASILTRKPLLLRVPGDYAWEQGQQRFGVTETLDAYLTDPSTSRFPVRILAWIQNRVARQAHHVIVPSEYMKSVVGKWGVPLQKMTCVYSALKLISVPETKETLRTLFGYKNFVVVTAARLVPWKGVQMLIDVVSAMQRHGTPISLQIIGDGVCRAALEAHTRAIGATQYVQFTGALPREELGKRIKAADAFVLNTSYEGLSHQLIEVMSIGTPIVTTAVGGNAELIAHEESGLLTAYNNVEEMTAAIYNVMNDSARASLRSTRASAQVERFKEEVVIKEFITCLQTRVL